MKITDELRDKLRKPLPPEAVSTHPTRTYLSSIKSIYVAERINDVFGVGSWTLKGELVERVDKFVIMKVVLEIPEHDFYGESYGGNDNDDPGDAYKGAVTDGFTKIAGQQLEIGIDVFKGKGQTTSSVKQSNTATTEHWCADHEVNFFKKGKMKSFAHKIEGTDDWCHERSKKEPDIKQAEKDIEELFPKSPETAQDEQQQTTTLIDADWLKTSLQTLAMTKPEVWNEKNILSFMAKLYKVEGKTVLEAAGKLDAGMEKHFCKHILDALK